MEPVQLYASSSAACTNPRSCSQAKSVSSISSIETHLISATSSVGQQCFAVPNDRGPQRRRGAAVPGAAAKGAPGAAGGFRLFQSSHIRRAEPVGLGAAKGKLLLKGTKKLFPRLIHL